MALRGHECAGLGFLPVTLVEWHGIARQDWDHPIRLNALFLSESFMNLPEMPEPGYDAFEVGYLAQLQNVQASYLQGSYPQLSLDTVYSQDGMMPLQNMCLEPKEEYNPQVSPNGFRVMVGQAKPIRSLLGREWNPVTWIEGKPERLSSLKSGR